MPTDDAGSGTDARFWDVVAQDDLDAFTAALGVDSSADVADVLPALRSWQGRRELSAAVDRLTYGVTWSPAGPLADVPVDSGWLIVEGQGDDHGWGDALAAELTARGAAVSRLQIAADEIGRDELAARLLKFAGHQRVVSLLGLADGAFAGDGEVPWGLAGTLGLVQGAADAGVSGRIWVVTSGAVAAGPGDVVGSPLAGGLWGLGRVVALEDPSRWGGLVDVPDRPERGRWSG